MNDDPHLEQGLGQSEAERIKAHPNSEEKEKAFRLSVARKFFCEAKDTLEIAQELKVDEAAVYAVLDQARKEKISA